MRAICALIAGDVVVERVVVEQVALLGRGRSGRRSCPVAPPARAIGRWPAVLEPAQHEQADQVAGVQAVGRRVAAVVERDRALLATPRRAAQDVAVGAVLDEAARLEVGEQVHSGIDVGTAAGVIVGPFGLGAFDRLPPPAFSTVDEGERRG